jgi:hypothetical protein
VSEARVVFYGLALIYLIGVVVQFFLAGLALFGSTSYDVHRVVGFMLGLVAVALLVIAVAAKMPRSLSGLSIVLVTLNVVQIVLIQVDIEEINALHVVNALAIGLVANMLVQRSRRFLASKLVTP